MSSEASLSVVGHRPFRTLPDDYDSIEMRPPPWRLTGPMASMVGFVDVAAVRPMIPEDVQVIPVVPGKTMGALLIADYQDGATVRYSELVVVGAITRSSGRLGVWMTHVYVNNGESLKSGIEIYGLRKELAEFDWTWGEHPTVRVHQDDLVLAEFAWQRPRVAVPLPMRWDVNGTVRGDRRRFKGRGTVSGTFRGAEVKIPPSSPFASLRLDRPLAALGGRMNMVMRDVEVVRAPRTGWSAGST